MRIVILAAAACASLPAAAFAQNACKSLGPDPAAVRSPLEPARAQRLEAMPDADLVLAVRRTVGGCDYVDVVRTEVSAPSRLNARRHWKPAPRMERAPARQ
jgi:hypothetical protein